MSNVYAATWSQTEVCELDCHWGSRCYLWPTLPRETMLRSMALTDARGHVDACGPCCCQIPWESPWFMLLTVKDRGASAVVSMTHSWGWETWKASVTSLTSPQIKSKNLDRKPWKRSLKNCDKNVEVQHFTIETGCVWKDSFSLRTTQIGIFKNPFFGGKGHRVAGWWTWEDWKVRVIRICYMKFKMDL